jgi:ATP-binding cassette subfamily B protein
MGVTVEKEKQKKIFDLQLLLKIFSFAKPYAAKFYLSTLLAVVLAVLAPVRPLLINETLKKTNEVNDSSIEIVTQFLLIITLVQVGLLVLESFFRFLIASKTTRFGV